jgi:NADPH:quinone reductase-like Zn-dependent oxidoreductase
LQCISKVYLPHKTGLGAVLLKAIITSKYGSPDVLEFKEVDKPIPNDDQVLVNVYAASVNPLDWHILRGQPFLVRLMGFGLFKPKNKILGADVAGRVEAVGKKVSQFKPGDEVFGGTLGCFAEYVSFSEKHLAPKPRSISFEQAAAVPVAALTALQGLRKGNIQPGQKVLINGASGGVGTFAVQIAKYFGAEVTGVCSTRNLKMVRTIGADHVIDYTKEDFASQGYSYDLILDNVATRSISKCPRLLDSRGSYVMVGSSSMALFFQIFLFGSLISVMSGKKIQSMMTNRNKTDLFFLKELLEAGLLVPVIDRQYKLSEVPDAIRYLEEGHARGKVVITVKGD